MHFDHLRCRSGSFGNPVSPGARIGRCRRGEAICGVDPTTALDFGVSDIQHLVFCETFQMSLIVLRIRIIWKVKASELLRKSAVRLGGIHCLSGHSFVWGRAFFIVRAVFFVVRTGFVVVHVFPTLNSKEEKKKVLRSEKT